MKPPVTPRARTVFLGTGEFAVPILAALAEISSVELIAVVSAPRRDGSNARLVEPPVVAWAATNGVSTFRPHRLRAETSVEHIRSMRPELLVLADYGQIVPEEILHIPVHGALNIHPSLLPRFRGATPIPAAILAGDAATGVTLMKMDAGLDSGPIVAQQACELTGTETAPQLEHQLASLGAQLLTATLDNWLAGNIVAQPQDESGASFTRSLRRSDGRLDPRKTAPELERQVRAYQPWPGSFLETSEGRLVVWLAHIGKTRPSEVAPGTLVAGDNGGLALAAEDAVLDLDEIQPAGGRRMSGRELLLGRPGLIGSLAMESAKLSA